MKRIGVFFLIGVVAASLTGCITFLTQIKVRGDGSGTMVQTMTMNPEQIKASMESMAKQMGVATTGLKEGPKYKLEKTWDEGPIKESDLKGKVSDFGQGVTFV